MCQQVAEIRERFFIENLRKSTLQGFQQNKWTHLISRAVSSKKDPKHFLHRTDDFPVIIFSV